MIRWLRQALRRRRTRRGLRPALHAEPRTRRVPLPALLVGDQAGRSLEEWVAATGDYGRVSLPLVRSSYVSFLQEVRSNPDRIEEDDFLKGTAYFWMAEHCRTHTGKWFGARTEEELLLRLRAYACSIPELAGRFQNFGEGERIRGRSLQDEPIRVFRIRESDCWELMDGHHRAARAVLEGERELEVEEVGEKWSYLQRAVLLGVQTRGRRELYQPIDSLEFRDGWSLVRRCSDRFAMMETFLDDRGMTGQGGRVLDLACSYGWFLSGFSGLGFFPSGVELDHLSIEIGRAAYRLPAGTVTEGAVESFLRRNRERFDIVLFLSILHHYVIGREKTTRFGMRRPDPVAEMLGALDRATGKVLFLDTGEQHEEWFREKLPGWTPEKVAGVIAEHTTFSEIIPLGKDRDAELFPGNYGRTLFACVR